MKIINKINCETSYRRDGNTKYTPVVTVVKESSVSAVTDDNVILRLDNGKKVEVDGMDLIKAIKNALNC